MNLTVLLYNFSKERVQLVRRSLAPLHINVKCVNKKDFSQPVGYMAGIDGLEPVKGKGSVADFDEEMLVMCGFMGEMIDVLIAALRMGGVGKVELKAVITESNALWDGATLYKALSEERAFLNE